MGLLFYGRANGKGTQCDRRGPIGAGGEGIERIATAAEQAVETAGVQTADNRCDREPAAAKAYARLRLNGGTCDR